MATNRIDRITGSIRQKIVSSDFTVDFSVHPDTGDLLRLLNDNAIKRSLRNIIQTNLFERKYNPHFGSNIRKLLFENATPQTSQALKSEIEHSINSFEPRARISDVKIFDDSNHNRYRIDIYYTTVQLMETQNLTVFLYRTR
jgi:phage baseplate assembly protein W